MNKKYFMVCMVLSMIMGVNISHGVEGKEKLTIDEFLKTADTDFKLQNQRELTQYLENSPSSTPYVDRMEFRTETEDFDLEKQKYSLRFYPKGWGETAYTRRVAELATASSRTEERNDFNTALMHRYELTLDYLEITTLIHLKKELTMVCGDRIHVLDKKSRGSLSFDISDLILAEELSTKLRLELVGLENKATELTRQIRLAANCNAPIAFDRAPLAGIPAIEKAINALTVDLPLNSIKLQDQKNKMDLAHNKYRLEQAKHRDYLSFFEVSYDSDDYDDFDKACSLEMAVKLPFIHSDQDAVNRKKVAYMEKRLQYREEMRTLREKRISLTRSLDRLIRQYKLLSANKTNSNAEVSFKTYLKMDGMDPLNLLKIKESMIQSDIQRIKTGFNIRSRFIELMDLMGKLPEQPVKNYICF